MNENLVSITDLADFCAEGTKEKVEEAKKQILSGENGMMKFEILSNMEECFYYIENRIKIRCTENRNWKNENPCKISLFYHLSIYFHVAIQIILIY